MRTSNPYLVSLLKQGLLPNFIFLHRELRKAESKKGKQKFSTRLAQAEETGSVLEHKMKNVHKEGEENT